MFEGYARAVERFHAAVKTNDETAIFIPLFEALNWAVALDERIGQHWTSAKKRLGLAWRQQIDGAEIMQGIRFARNSVHHQWSDALELSRGHAYPKSYPVIFFEWRWRPVDYLPESKKEKQNKYWAEGKAVYETIMEGKPARTSLEKLAEVFFLLRQLLEPSSLRPLPSRQPSRTASS